MSQHSSLACGAAAPPPAYCIRDSAVLQPHLQNEITLLHKWCISHLYRSETARHSAAQTRQMQRLAKNYPDNLNHRNDLQTEYVALTNDLRGVVCSLLSCLFSTRVRVCDHFNTIADQHGLCNAYLF